ncbi:hypothetical protein PHAVU_002G281600 [Phaseolus vulgaris]|uniref:Anaphase-promoting complex subunit 4 WD40 domain-containing protein n=1 Tax=Phaseolus vulgaris TaxID=3885 RepID=V7CP79_PHAVU|nr:hypothetical protein PHAVU_002G281600g [Phaseolus vulgaris]ESW31949.1 hypothetical protein PHAVU_002G281600g [Phaseolus vulgaris]
MEHHENGVVNGRQEHEEALLALVEHRTREVKHLRYYISYYTSQLEEAEKRLLESKSKLALLRGVTSASSSHVDAEQVKVERESKIGSFHKSDGSCSSKNHLQSGLRLAHVGSKCSHSVPLPPSSLARVKVKSEKNQTQSISTERESIEVQGRGSKRKVFEQKEAEEVIRLICKNSKPESVLFQTSYYPCSSQHKRRLRCIAVSPVNDRQFVTSALDGVVNVWEVFQSKSNPHLITSTNCISPQQRWPEDIVWHPNGNSLLSVYSADGLDSQISVTDFSRVKDGGISNYVNFLEDKPHTKGVINSIAFLPRENTSFVTGGTDHAVVLWRENGHNKWKPEALHRNLHSSAVMGVSGMQYRQLVLSVGKDKRILGYDAHVGRTDFKQQVDSKCLSVLPNPCDFNLFMVQTGTPERQLRFFDIRSKRTELHAFGWKQESSESQSALINQAWSPNGVYITSGSADPMFHIFDIRYNGRKPSQSIESHDKRVFRVMWLRSLPLLISISSDLRLGLHQVV